MLPQAQPAATVVVCEDDAPTLDLLCDHLEADRFHALPAPSAADAVRLGPTTAQHDHRQRRIVPADRTLRGTDLP